MGLTYPQATTYAVEAWKQVPVSPITKQTDAAKKILVDALKEEDVKLLKFHQSLCPSCVEEEHFDQMMIPSLLFVKNNKVWMIKHCAKHGITREIYWADFDLYKHAERFQDHGLTITTPQITKKTIDCPFDCGLCGDHESHTGLGNIAVTNRCDLTCWYCFFYAEEGDRIYEPTLEQFKQMYQKLRDTKPFGASAIQLTGGEPTLRPDLVEIIRLGKTFGFNQIQLNTNGVNISKSLKFCNDLRDAGVNTLYLSFDGMTPQTNPKNYWEAQQAIENCRKSSIGIVLVPTVIGSVNDHELGDIIRFALSRSDIIHAVNFQPVSFVGRMPDSLRMQQRITIPGAIKRIEEQTNGQIGKEHWFPVPSSTIVTDFLDALQGKPCFRMSIHFACGMGTYLFKDGERVVPLGDFFDIEEFLHYLPQLTNELNKAAIKSAAKASVIAKALVKINQLIDNKKKPKNIQINKILASIVTGGNYEGLAEWHRNSLFLGMMHFQDPYNWDIDRIHKCDIHYATPDGRIIPFCTFNVIPELYRDKIQQAFSITGEEWEKKTGKKLKDDLHRRNLSNEEIEKITQEYDKYRNNKTKQNIEPDWGNDEIKLFLEKNGNAQKNEEQKKSLRRCSKA
ncbi:MAG: radical SAM protein [Candidatus Aenigmarchaeota archaeon]|nr:radical SAM protein [Candidatus Aenigmarchaeota archaeon]